jgi:ATP adenylyltransferase
MAGKMKSMRCAFCGKTQDSVPKLIVGSPDGGRSPSAICTECVALCVAIHREDGVELDAAPPSDPSTVPGGDRAPTQDTTGPSEATARADARDTGDMADTASPTDTTRSTGMARLGAPWRGEYITEATDAERRPDAPDPHTVSGCVFCRILAEVAAGQVTAAQRHIVHTGERALVILNAYPYTSGHLMVMPTRHVGALDELDDDEYREVWSLLREATAAIGRAYAPEGLNVGLNLGRAAGAGVPGHLHVHAVPRWNGDTNFMTSIAETRVVPESLDRTLTRITAAWTV